MRIFVVSEDEFPALKEMCTSFVTGDSYADFLQKQDEYRAHLRELGIESVTVKLSVGALAKWRSKRRGQPNKALTRHDVLLYLSLIDEEQQQK